MNHRQTHYVGYNRWGKHVEEGKFYTHAMSLIYFLTMYEDMTKRATQWYDPELKTGEPPELLFSFRAQILDWLTCVRSSSPVYDLPVVGTSLGIPEMWVWVILNVVTQYFCISGVYSLVSSAGALTTTLLLTLRKFISLFFSVWYVLAFSIWF